MFFVGKFQIWWTYETLHFTMPDEHVLDFAAAIILRNDLMQAWACLIFLEPLNLHQYTYVYPYVLNQTAITWRKPHFETPLGIGHPAMTLRQRSFRKLKSWLGTWSKNNPGATFNPSKSNIIQLSQKKSWTLWNIYGFAQKWRYTGIPPKQRLWRSNDDKPW